RESLRPLAPSSCRSPRFLWPDELDERSPPDLLAERVVTLVPPAPASDRDLHRTREAALDNVADIVERVAVWLADHQHVDVVGRRPAIAGITRGPGSE